MLIKTIFFDNKKYVFAAKKKTKLDVRVRHN